MRVEALQDVFSEDSYRRCARSVAEEIGRLPAVAECVPFLEEVATRA